jgi:hypothetical protein
MTYIKKYRRAALDTIIEGLVNRLRSIDPVRGDLSYTVTRIVLESLRPVDGWTRQALADCVASLYEASDEIQRRMTDPFGDTEIEINGDLACFQEEWNQPLPHECRCSTTRNPCVSEGIHPPFNADYTRRTQASPSLAPGMALEDLGVRPENGELTPITKALTDEQIEEAELERNAVVSFMYSDKLGGVTAYRPYTGVGTLLPDNVSFAPTVDAVITEVTQDRDLDKWVKDIPIKVWRRMVSEGTSYETGEE